ncbi:hypothetical protein T05_13706 [Trichinella murrelli]|uniref:Uncharacterized protein n=1 Tax=Trichinella murrelli TaxID=144512 RepID=A0A0V0TEC2_9BILA|nr:hypothetical protein T05_13706 [Trichinella murrelli]
MGINWIGDPSCPILLYFVCGKQLSSAAMAPAKLNGHFMTNHSQGSARIKLLRNAGLINNIAIVTDDKHDKEFQYSWLRKNNFEKLKKRKLIVEE